MGHYGEGTGRRSRFRSRESRLDLVLTCVEVQCIPVHGPGWRKFHQAGGRSGRPLACALRLPQVGARRSRSRRLWAHGRSLNDKPVGELRSHPEIQSGAPGSCAGCTLHICAGCTLHIYARYTLHTMHSYRVQSNKNPDSCSRQPSYTVRQYAACRKRSCHADMDAGKGRAMGEAAHATPCKLAAGHRAV